jgi:hypothetical protein
MIKHWTLEEENKLKELKAKGMKLKDIAVELGRTYQAVATRSKRLNPIHKGGNPSWTQDEVALLYQDYDYNELEQLLPKSRRAIMSKCEKLGISKRFPGSNKSVGTMYTDKVTTLYLVDFGSFKKVGITQVDLEIRFKQDKPFKILDKIELDLDEAKYFEEEILRNMRGFRVLGDIRRGFGECFDYNCTQLEDLL